MTVRKTSMYLVTAGALMAASVPALAHHRDWHGGGNGYGHGRGLRALIVHFADQQLLAFEQALAERIYLLFREISHACLLTTSVPADL